jgi:rhodanese-related sulfurtransferase
MRRWLPAALALVLLGAVTPAPADDPEVPEKYIKVDEAKALVDQKRRLAFIDVRPREQYAELHIRGAVSIPLKDLPRRIAEVPKNIPVVLY